ncbi:hypothetical protein AMECASPLE_033987, partial [Ameca splendens]
EVNQRSGCLLRKPSDQSHQPTLHSRLLNLHEVLLCHPQLNFTGHFVSYQTAGGAAAPFRGEHKQSEGFAGSCGPAAVLLAECLAGSSAHWSVLQHQPLQAAESLLLLVKLHSSL